MNTQSESKREKAYKVIDPTLFEYPYRVTEDDWQVVYATSPGKAKRLCREYSTYLNIRVKRCKKADKIEFEGRETTVASRDFILKERARIQARLVGVQSHPDDETFYIQNGYVGNSVLWWAINGNGYTVDLEKAHEYTKDEVISHFVNSRPDDVIWAASHVRQHIRKHVDGQYLNLEYCVR